MRARPPALSGWLAVRWLACCRVCVKRLKAAAAAVAEQRCARPVHLLLQAGGGSRVCVRRQAKMYTNFKDKAIEYVKAAVEADNAGDYQRALDN